MSVTYLYAILDRRPEAAIEVEAGEGAVRFFGRPGLVLAVATFEAPPALDEGELRRHDAVVRALAARAGALLPVRFGCHGRDARALAAQLAPVAPDIRRALAAVRGCEQMTLRVFSGGTPPAKAAGALGPGRQYLERLAARGAPLPALSRGLAGVVSAERIEAGAAPPLVASLYHLLPRGRGDEYRQAVDALRSAVQPHSLRVSGPWPAYAFAPEGLS